MSETKLKSKKHAMRKAKRGGNRVRVAPTETMAADIAARESIARASYNPASAAAARAAFLKRQTPEHDDAR